MQSKEIEFPEPRIGFVSTRISQAMKERHTGNASSSLQRLWKFSLYLLMNISRSFVEPTHKGGSSSRFMMHFPRQTWWPIF